MGSSPFLVGALLWCVLIMPFILQVPPLCTDVLAHLVLSLPRPGVAEAVCSFPQPVPTGTSQGTKCLPPA